MRKETQNQVPRQVFISESFLDKQIEYLQIKATTLPRADQAKLTDFRLFVWAVCSAVPRGYVTTYAAIAAALGLASPRAVGQALRHNPFNPVVPCHRVVNSTGRLHGFGGSTDAAALGRKRGKLAAEGVPFKDADCVDPQAMCVFDVGKAENDSFSE